MKKFEDHYIVCGHGRIGEIELLDAVIDMTGAQRRYHRFGYLIK